MPAVSVAIFKPASANCCALEWSAGCACGIFSLCMQLVLHLAPRAVKQWVRIAHDLLPGETPP